MQDILLRKIQPGDNKFLASIVRETLEEFGANRPGTVFFDDSTDQLYELFQQQGAVYYVVEKYGEILGGAGIFPSSGLAPGVCELSKMYLKKIARGLGLGKKLIETCLEFASQNGYSSVYLETMPELKKAVTLYQRFGFKFLKGPMGNTGHYGCDIWMQKKFKAPIAGALN
ncbi:MAG: GNAT family N-acetyltransferase [Chitinophagaceae bacterium]